ncbi:MAG: hypothetical protein ACLTD2_00870 [Ruminococcus sp.]
MIIGVTGGESYCLHSDVPAILKYTRNVYYRQYGACKTYKAQLLQSRWRRNTERNENYRDAESA